MVLWFGFGCVFDVIWCCKFGDRLGLCDFLLLDVAFRFVRMVWFTVWFDLVFCCLNCCVCIWVGGLWFCWFCDLFVVIVAMFVGCVLCVAGMVVLALLCGFASGVIRF